MKFLKITQNIKFEDLEKNLISFYNIDKIKVITYEKEINSIYITFDDGRYDVYQLDENLKTQLEKMGVKL